MSEFYTVGQLRALLEGLPDDRQVLCQVVASNGQAWNMVGQFSQKIGSFSCLQMKHENLTNLPASAFQEEGEHG